MPLFEKACCCMTLLQGAQIFGYVGALASIYDFSRTVIKVDGEQSADFLKCNVLIMQFLFVVAALCLVGATVTENRKLVLPWLIIFCPAILFMNIVILFFSYDVTGHVITYQDYRARLFILGNLDGFGIYVWLCIFAYYQSLKDYRGDDQCLLLDVECG